MFFGLVKAASIIALVIQYFIVALLEMSLREPELQAWNISENQFPTEATKSEQLKFLLNYAIIAPSSHNTQPWLFKIVGDNIIELYADRTRALAVVDPDDRELTISCGAALSHLQIAIRHFGYVYKVKLFAGSINEDLLAQVSAFIFLNVNRSERVGIIIFS
jgi:nitroreductase